MRSPHILTTTTLLLALGALCGCKADGSGVINPFAQQAPETVVAPSEDPNGWSTGAADTGSALYGWDGAPVGGGPVSGPTPGAVQVQEGGLSHGLEGAGGGSRLVLLELYSAAVEEREQLALEVDAQNSALEQAERRFAEVQARMAELQNAYDTLSAAKSAVEEERRALAARLTTAQIRRLEAEKAYLEAAIEWRGVSQETVVGREHLDHQMNHGDDH
jgi:hypothetical protein